ncbi:MAG: class I SAM-dependent methyltransferase [Pseudomonadota bacterium]
MTQTQGISTQWTESLGENETPCAISLRAHLLEVHRRHPGFTESCATKCRNDDGQTSYEWLLDTVDPSQPTSLLDLACGAGYLLNLCHQKLPPASNLVGVDLSASELSLARKRLSGTSITLHEGLAQDLSFAPSNSFDAVLCHWALTLMSPVEPVFEEVIRILRPGGIFAAIVDGATDVAPGYEFVNDLIFQYVQRELPTYGDQELGDKRTRNPATLHALAESFSAIDSVQTETQVFSLKGAPRKIAEEAAGFFYAAFVLPEESRQNLLDELTEYFAETRSDGASEFLMPICKLTVVKG